MVKPHLIVGEYIQVIVVQVEYKIVVQNCVECIHVKFNHPNVCHLKTKIHYSFKFIILAFEVGLSQQAQEFANNQGVQWPNSPSFIPNTQTNSHLLPQFLQPQAPAGIILPPPDTALSVDSFFVQKRAETSINILGRSIINNSFTTQSPFPTLIPWNENENQNQNVLPSDFSNKQHGISKFINSNIKDGEARVNLRNNNKRGFLNPAQLTNNNNMESLEQLKQNSKEEIEKSQKITNLEVLKPKQILNSNHHKNSENGALMEHVPPLPAHPEITWLPLKFNIKPSSLNTSEALRTTISAQNIIATTKASILSEQLKNGQLTDILNEINNKIEINNQESSKSIYSNEDIGTEFTSAKPKGQVSFSFKRRGDLPIPFEENLGNKISYSKVRENKVWTTDHNTQVQIHNQTTNESSQGLFGNSKLI